MNDLELELEIRFCTCFPLIIYIRVWQDRPKYSMMAWWQESGNCKLTKIVDAEQNIVDREIYNATLTPQREFEDFVKSIGDTGIRGVPSQTERLTTCHFDDTIGLKERDAKLINWIKIPGGKHRDNCVNESLTLIYNKFPELF